MQCLIVADGARVQTQTSSDARQPDSAAVAAGAIVVDERLGIDDEGSPCTPDASAVDGLISGYGGSACRRACRRAGLRGSNENVALIIADSAAISIGRGVAVHVAVVQVCVQGGPET